MKKVCFCNWYQHPIQLQQNFGKKLLLLLLLLLLLSISDIVVASSENDLGVLFEPTLKRLQ